jgi:hypothetical protein
MVIMLSSEMNPQFAMSLNFPLHSVWPIGLDSLVNTQSEEQLMGFVPDAMRQIGGPINTLSDLFVLYSPC